MAKIGIKVVSYSNISAVVKIIFEDAEPFPYDLSEEELKAEVRYSLGIEPYPKT